MATDYFDEAVRAARAAAAKVLRPVNLGDALFGEYTCKRCCSYLHKDSDHREQGTPLADRPDA